MAAPSTAAATYAAKLKDPRWQKKRLEVLQRAEWSCEMCGDAESTLHVHHKQYFKGRDPWEYDEDQLAALCVSCHEVGHDSTDPLLEIISRLPVDGPCGRETVAKLIAGFVGREPVFDFGRMYWHVGNIAAAIGWLGRPGIEKLSSAFDASSPDPAERNLALAVDGLMDELRKRGLVIPELEASNA